MSGELRYDGRVVVITGAGGGLGRAYALLFGSRGAKVVVNDLGGSFKGEGASTRAADVVVEEIKKLGGQAVANYDSVENGEKIIKTAIDTWGRVDIVINNAGILRDVSFLKMRDQDWEMIYKVHLLGAFKVTKAAWNYMRDQGFGRIIMTSSAAGIYGNFGQANYSAMKLALYGFSSTLALEGASKNVYCNTIAPIAGSRMTETVMPPDLVAALKPEYVAPLVAYLCHDSSKVNGGLFEVGAGWVSRLRWQRTQGAFMDVKNGLSPEMIRDNWSKVDDWTNASNPSSTTENMTILVGQLQKHGLLGANNTSGGSIDLKQALGYKFPPTFFEMNEKAAILYALAIGEGLTNQVDPESLKFTFEGADQLYALPTMGAIFALGASRGLSTAPGMSFNPMMLLHGEQHLELKKAIPTSGRLTTSGRIANIYDKGKAALVVIESTTTDERNETVCVNRMSVFIRGVGGFGGDKGPAPENFDPPARAPDAVASEKTLPNQALFYRWVGEDLNPLHASPQMAAMGGFDKPILHGLCSFGYAGRAVLKHFGGGNADAIKSIKVRFTRHVFPGETIVTEMWKVSDNKVVFRCKVAERPDGYVLSNACVELRSGAASASVSISGGVTASDFRAAAVFQALESHVAASGPELVKQVAGVYHFKITAGGKTQSWTVDLKNGKGKVAAGAPENADCTILIGDDDFVAMMSGQLDSQKAFMQGKIKIQGNMALAMKLKLLSKPKSKM